MDENMKNWSDLCFDPLETIARKVKKIEDFTAFRSTCTSWKEVASTDNFTGICLWQNRPYLMLPGKDEDQVEREFYSLLKEKIVHKVSLPEAKGKICLESQGWFLAMGERGSMSLLNPFSPCSKIQLPHSTTMPDYRWNETEPEKFIQKVVLSSKSSDFVVMAIVGGAQVLMFWKSGDKTWRTIETHGAFKFIDITCCHGQFFGINSQGNIWRLNILGPNPTKAELITRIPREEVHFYIMESSGKLLVVVWPGGQSAVQKGCSDRKIVRRIFQLFEVDSVKKTWKEIKNLGRNAAFIGYSSSVLIQASKFPGIKANHIYYAGSGMPTKQGEKLVCIYNLDDGSIESLDEPSRRWATPFRRSFWVTPNF